MPENKILTADSAFDKDIIGNPGGFRLCISGFTRNLKTYIDEGNFEQAKAYADECRDLLWGANQEIHELESALSALREERDALHVRIKREHADPVWIAESGKCAKIGETLRTQDNLMTANPQFIVQQKRRVYGFDPNYGDAANTVWIDEECCEVEWDENSDEDPPDTYIQTSYCDNWEFVTACFTRTGCEDYIRANEHNLKEPRIYVASGHRNIEWERLRKHFAALSPNEQGEVAPTINK